MAKVKSITIRVGQSLDEAEKALLIATLDHHNGDKGLAAQDLGVNKRTIYNLMRRYGLFVETQARVREA